MTQNTRGTLSTRVAFYEKSYMRKFAAALNITVSDALMNYSLNDAIHVEKTRKYWNTIIQERKEKAKTLGLLKHTSPNFTVGQVRNYSLCSVYKYENPKDLNTLRGMCIYRPNIRESKISGNSDLSTAHTQRFNIGEETLGNYLAISGKLTDNPFGERIALYKNRVRLVEGVIIQVARYSSSPRERGTFLGVMNPEDVFFSILIV